MAKKEKSSKGKASAPKKAGIFARIGTYFHDVRLELKRVVWPTKAEVINSSIVVIVTLIFFIVFIYIVDALILPALNAFAKLGG